MVVPTPLVKFFTKWHILWLFLILEGKWLTLFRLNLADFWMSSSIGWTYFDLLNTLSLPLLPTILLRIRIVKIKLIELVQRRSILLIIRDFDLHVSVVLIVFANRCFVRGNLFISSLRKVEVVIRLSIVAYFRRLANKRSRLLVVKKIKIKIQIIQVVILILKIVFLLRPAFIYRIIPFWSFIGLYWWIVILVVRLRVLLLSFRLLVFVIPRISTIVLLIVLLDRNVVQIVELVD